MEEIIAERDKSFFLLITVVGIISMIGCIVALIYFPSLLWFYIFGISVMGMIILIGVIGLCFPNWVIIKEANTIIIHNGFRGIRKRILKITDIVCVRIKDLTQQSKVKHCGNIVLTIKSENSSTQDIVVIQIKNCSEVVEKLNLLIQK